MTKSMEGRKDDKAEYYRIRSKGSGILAFMFIRLGKEGEGKYVKEDSGKL